MTRQDFINQIKEKQLQNEVVSFVTNKSGVESFAKQIRDGIFLVWDKSEGMTGQQLIDYVENAIKNSKVKNTTYYPFYIGEFFVDTIEDCDEGYFFSLEADV